MNSIPLVVAVRTYQVFPFDFSAYEFNWTALARIVIGFTVVAVSIALLVELVKLVRFGYEAFQPR